SKTLLLPLFPCYIFLHGGLDRRIDIMTTPGVHAFVENANRPAVIPDAQIDGVRQTVASSLRVEPYPLLKSGDRVRVRFGPLEGIEGILVRKKNLSWLVLSVEMLGKSIAVEIQSSMVEKVAAPTWSSPITTAARFERVTPAP
ncbi:MAG: transcription termination/antitermination protein NusG, partial [Terriglobia bacterium]